MKPSTAAASTLTHLGLVVFLALASGCGTPADGGPTLDLESLAACPPGDRPWREALRSAEAEERLDELRDLALELSATHPERWEPRWTAAECLFRTGLRERSMDRLARSRPELETALALAERHDEPVGVAAVANRLGWLASQLDHDLLGAESWYRRAIEEAERADRDDLTSIARANLPMVLTLSGRLAEAVEVSELAVAGLRRAGLVREARQAARHQANLLRQLGQLVGARELLDPLYEESLAAGDSEMVGRIGVSQGNIALLLDEPAVAREWFAKVPADSPRFSAAAWLGLGKVALREGDPVEAANHLDRAIGQEVVPMVALVARYWRAVVELEAGRPAECRRRLEPLIEAADEIRVKELAWMAESLHAKTLLVEGGSLDEAVARLRRAVEILESQGEGLSATEEGLAYLRERAEPFADLAAALVLLGGDGASLETAHEEAVLAVVERAHARALRRVLDESAEHGLEPATVKTLRKGLGPDELFLDFLIGQDRGVVVAISPTEVRAKVLPGWRELRTPLVRYRQALIRPAISMEARLDEERDLRRDIEAAKQLRRDLLGPVWDLVQRATRIYAVPDQALALLPLTALPQDASGSELVEGPLRFLGDDKEFGLLPMAGLPPARSLGDGPVLLAGAPIPDAAGVFPALPLALDELAALREVWGEPRTTVLEGERLARRELASLPLADYSTVHLATHAVASSLDPRRCAVILSHGERMTMQDIAALDWGSGLVVLSACRTGEGEIIPGEGMLGLSWAFLRSGVRGVTASLWSVEDASTAALMAEYHRGLRAGDDPVAALAAAGRRIGRDRRHPMYWAPFVLILSPRRGE